MKTQRKTFNYYLVLILFFISIYIPPLYSAPSFSEGQKVGVVDGHLINEASGLVASIQNPGHFWVHNDSGGEARLFLISETGSLAAIVHIEGAENSDWEDIAIGQPSKFGFPVIFIGDLGDNFHRNTTKEVYLVREPKLSLSEKSILEKTVPVLETVEIGFKEKRMDIETLLFDPISDALFFVSKRLKRPALLQIEKNDNEDPPYYFKKVGELPLKNMKSRDNISGGDISQDGRHILIKTYDDIYYWTRNENETISESLKRVPQRLLYKPEPQGEAIGWSIKNNFFYTVSEHKFLSSRWITFYRYQSY